MIMEKLFYTDKEAALVTGIQEREIKELRLSRKLPFLQKKDGKKVLIKAEDLKAFVLKNYTYYPSNI